MAEARVLLVEDEATVGATLNERLRAEGFDVQWARNLEEAKTHLDRGIDLALLDVGLPDGIGFELVPLLRKKRPEAAIVFLTAFGDADDRVQGLELGAEDYIVKPFHYKELLLRVRNVLRRAKSVSQAPDEVVVGPTTIRFSRYEIESAGQVHALTHKEGAVLKILYDRRGKVVSRDEILDEVWSQDEYPTPRTIDNFVLRLRRWVEIRSVRGVGYQLEERS